MINRSTARDTPNDPMALYLVALLFGTLVAETILASVHVRAHQQAGHMGASDLIKTLQNTLRGGGRPHMWRVQPSTTREWHELPRAEDDGDSCDRCNDIRARRFGGHGREISQTRGAIQM